MRPAYLVLALAALAAATAYGVRWWGAQHATLAFVGAAVPVPDLELTFFPDQLAFAQPSPPPAYGERQLAAGERLTIGRELVPARALVRYRGAGIGAGFTHVELGQSPPPVVLRAPSTLRGRVGEPIAIWSAGWRCAGLRPIAGAEVWLMGGGEHGVDLARATTDAEGRFTIEGVDGDLDGLGLRVRASGFALLHESLARFGPGAQPEPQPQPQPGPVLALARGTTQRGTVVLPAGVDASSLRVLARGLPGVEAAIAADGSFVLDHLPRSLQPRLLLHGLAPTWCCPQRHAGGSEPVRIEVVAGAAVRGRVLEVATNRAIAGALVWAGDGEAVRTDADGGFELQGLPAGELELNVQHQTVDRRRRRTTWTGHRRVTAVAGQSLDNQDIVISIR